MMFRAAFLQSCQADLVSTRSEVNAGRNLHGGRLKVGEGTEIVS